MIAPTRHKEKAANGDFVYVIRPYLRDPLGRITSVHNKDFTGERFKVKFWNGIGRTTSREKAKRFSEEFEYLITLHEEDTPWDEASVERSVSTFDGIEEESAHVIDIDEGE